MSLIDYIVLTVAVYFIMIAVQVAAAWRTQSLSTLAGPRDNIDDKGVFIGRCRRANHNMVEGMLLFFPLAFVALHTNPTGTLAVTGAAVFVFARIVYAFMYWFGVPWLRTLTWAVSLLGLILIFLQVLPV
ncbi:MAPEG family protein [Litorimonas haliclonae]|uniref:MAPEG family protein n=1 Tax=Litorimonas haliclonae TaxID=2081977 RepID=UPI0039F00775